jgi:hypothetical protein
MIKQWECDGTVMYMRDTRNSYRSVHRKQRQGPVSIDMDWGMIFKWILNKWDGDVWTVHFWVRIRDLCHTLVNMVMNLLIP